LLRAGAVRDTAGGAGSGAGGLEPGVIVPVRGANQTAAGSNCSTWTGLGLLRDGGAGWQPRVYWRGEQPMTLLNAVLNALSDS
jgi:hypothetical protein